MYQRAAAKGERKNLPLAGRLTAAHGSGMDPLLLVPSVILGTGRRRKRRRRCAIDEEGQAVSGEEEEELSTWTLLGYVNLKGSLIFADLAVGVAIPVYTEMMGLNIGAHAHQCVCPGSSRANDLLAVFALSSCVYRMAMHKHRRLS